MNAKRQPQTNPAIRRNGEKGMALVVALLAIMVLTGIGFALILSSSTETLIHGNFRQSGLALYAARAGVEEARGRLGQDLGLSPPALPPIKICGVAADPDAQFSIVDLCHFSSVIGFEMDALGAWIL